MEQQINKKKKILIIILGFLIIWFLLGLILDRIVLKNFDPLISIPNSGIIISTIFYTVLVVLPLLLVIYSTKKLIKSVFGLILIFVSIYFVSMFSPSFFIEDINGNGGSFLEEHPEYINQCGQRPDLPSYNSDTSDAEIFLEQLGQYDASTKKWEQCRLDFYRKSIGNIKYISTWVKYALYDFYYFIPTFTPWLIYLFVPFAP